MGLNVSLRAYFFTFIKDANYFTFSIQLCINYSQIHPNQRIQFYSETESAKIQVVLCSRDRSFFISLWAIIFSFEWKAL